MNQNKNEKNENLKNIKKDDKNKNNISFLYKKRKNEYDSEKFEILNEKTKEEKFCQNCNCILDKRKIDIQKLDDKDNINNLISILFNEKEKFENEIDNLIKSFHKNDENNKKNNNVFDFCDECLIKKFIKGGIENLLKTNEANLEEIINNCNEFLSENKKIELNISQTLNELNNLIKNKNINEKDIIQIINI